MSLSPYSLSPYGKLLVFLFPATTLAEDQPKAPNIILMLADDLGYGDLGIRHLRFYDSGHPGR